jgi:hypothetical protein
MAGVILILVGIGAIAAGVLGKNFYYDSGQKTAVWFGRSVCLIVGAGFIARGIMLLLDSN